jgi:nitrate reductase molybdenum cofactor assembly chaperone
MKSASEFDLLAALLRYPVDGYLDAAELCLEALSKSDRDAAMLVGQFLAQTRDFSVENLQELYIATFDLDPKCALEVGWHLFGENYERGEFLVKMRGTLRRLGISESTELPDHIMHALEAIGRMEPEEGAEFATACLFPALDKMYAGLQDKSNPFEQVLLAVMRVLERRYPRPDQVEVAAGPALRILDSGGW